MTSPLTPRFTIIILVFFICSNISAQKNSIYEIGINAGTLIYQGDIATSDIGNFQGLKPAFSFYVNKQLHNYFSARANLVLGSFSADESKMSSPDWKQHRNFSFSTSVAELSTLLVWNIKGENVENNYRNLKPYFFGGIGVTFLNIKRDFSKIDTTYFDAKSTTVIGLGIDKAKATPRTIIVIPVGAGLNYTISEKMGIKAEATYRFAFTDYIDGFSYAGNPSAKDSYYGFSIGLSYKLFNGGEYSCPSVKL